MINLIFAIHIAAALIIVLVGVCLWADGLGGTIRAYLLKRRHEREFRDFPRAM